MRKLKFDTNKVVVEALVFQISSPFFFYFVSFNSMPKVRGSRTWWMKHGIMCKVGERYFIKSSYFQSKFYKYLNYEYINLDLKSGLVSKKCVIGNA